mgnify:CR=1 FL=1
MCTRSWGILRNGAEREYRRVLWSARLVRVTQECVDLGLKAAKPWGHLGDIAYAINSHAKKHGYSVVLDAGLGHEDHVFYLGGEAVVDGVYGPVVVFIDEEVGASLVDHRFDGEHHAGNQNHLAALSDEHEFVQEGDILNVDVSTILNGYYSDASRMFTIGDISPEAARLVRVTQECVSGGRPDRGDS